MNELNARAVVIGSAVDVVGSVLLSFVFYAALVAGSGASTPEEVDAVLAASLALLVVQLLLGLAMTAAGAYVAARIVPRLERLHAFVVGVVSTLVGFLVVFSSPDSDPFWLQAAGLILTIPAAFVGGELARALRAGRKPT